MTKKVGSGSGISYSGSTILIVTISAIFLKKKIENDENVTVTIGEETD
jgi:hypothetical protein